MALDTAKGLAGTASTVATSETDAVDSPEGSTAAIVPEPAATYEEELNSLIDAIGQMVQVTMADQVNGVKQAVMDESVTELAVFFGKTKGEGRKIENIKRIVSSWFIINSSYINLQFSFVFNH